MRILGNSLGLSKNISNRHPFPGPGLGIRIIGNITKEKIKILQEADHIFINELNKIIFMIKYGKHMQLCCQLKQSELWEIQELTNILVYLEQSLQKMV